jgi:hypothetical protein
MDQERSEANALRTLDERRAAQAAREARDARPAPGYEQRDTRMPPQGYGYGNAPAPAPAPIIVNQNGGGGLGHVIAGAMIARSAANAHANNNNNNGGGYYPAPSGSAGGLANQAGAGSVGGSVDGSTGAVAANRGGSVLGAIARGFIWLCVLALIGWSIWFLLKRRKARREADKPNYSFERN